MNNREIFLHIGYPKTGTTTLQNHLFSKHNEVCDIKLDGNNSIFVRQLLFARENAFAREIKNWVNEIEDKIELSNKNKFIYSNENLLFYSMFLSNNPTPYIWTLEPNSIARKLDIAFKKTCLFKNVKVIIVIRRQDEILKSVYAEMYNLSFRKYKQTNTFKKFLNYSLRQNNSFIIDAIYYDDIVKEYEAIFGNDNVFIAVFEELKEDFKSFVRKLSNFMDIDYKIAMQCLSDHHDNKRSGEKYLSPKVNILDFLVQLKNKYTPNINLNSMNLNEKKWFKYINNFNIPGTSKKLKLNIPEMEQNYLKNIYADSNKKLSDRYNLELKKYNYY